MPKPIAEARGDDSPWLTRLQPILDKALAKQPGDRYQRIEDLQNDLQEVMREIELESSIGNTWTDATATASPVRWAKPGSAWTKPGRIAAVAAVILAVILSLVAFRSLYRATPSRCSRLRTAIRTLNISPTE
jgi:serine/threonine-protein kinase